MGPIAVRRAVALCKTFSSIQHGFEVCLMPLSDAVDIVVQAQAGIGCPLWAPIKFILKVGYLFTPVYPFLLILDQTVRGVCFPLTVLARYLNALIVSLDFYRLQRGCLTNTSNHHHNSRKPPPFRRLPEITSRAANTSLSIEHILRRC